jgi:hypothetical protein
MVTPREKGRECEQVISPSELENKERRARGDSERRGLERSQESKRERNRVRER